MSYHLIHEAMVIKKKKKGKKRYALVRMWRRESVDIGGTANCAATMENSMEVPQKEKNFK